MDARDKLRIYLEQRRDLGESELLLDSMTVDEALRTIGAAVKPSSSTKPTPREIGASSQAEDWRAALGPTQPAKAVPEPPAEEGLPLAEVLPTFTVQSEEMLDQLPPRYSRVCCNHGEGYPRDGRVRRR